MLGAHKFKKFALLGKLPYNKSIQKYKTLHKLQNFKPMENKKELLSLKEVSELLGVNPASLRRWDNEGKLKAVRIGNLGHRKYKRGDIDKLLT